MPPSSCGLKTKRGGNCISAEQEVCAPSGSSREITWQAVGESTPQAVSRYFGRQPQDWYAPYLADEAVAVRTVIEFLKGDSLPTSAGTWEQMS